MNKKKARKRYRKTRDMGRLQHKASDALVAHIRELLQGHRILVTSNGEPIFRA